MFHTRVFSNMGFPQNIIQYVPEWSFPHDFSLEGINLSILPQTERFKHTEDILGHVGL